VWKFGGQLGNMDHDVHDPDSRNLGHDFKPQDQSHVVDVADAGEGGGDQVEDESECDSARAMLGYRI
jgi:hypothetical protein